MSADGSFAVGTGSSANGFEAFRWTAGGGMVGLGDLAGGIFNSVAYGVSADGAVVVGQGNSASGNEAFRWTAGGGMVGLGDLAGGIFNSIARDVSGDGAVVVGQGNSASGNEAFRWTAGGGMVGLGDLAGGAFNSQATDVSADGTVVVGSGNGASGSEAFRWTAGGGMVGLGDLAGGAFGSSANGVSADGTVVVGSGNGASGSEAFRWTAADGMQSVEQWLVEAGVDVTGFTLTSAEDVSADGDVVVGNATTINGNEAFLARVSSVGSGILNVASVNQSLAQGHNLSGLGDAVLSLPMHGAHHRPLMTDENLNGGFCGWLTADGAMSKRGNDSYLFNQEIGVCHDLLGQKMRIGLGLGNSRAGQDTLLDGEQILDGQYGLLELNYAPFSRPVILSLTAMYGHWDSEISRGYLNGTTPDISRGDTSLKSGALRVGLHWDEAGALKVPTLPKITLSPKAYYTVARTEIDGYTENGGGFPVQFDERDLTTREARIGVEAETRIHNEMTKLRLTLEGVHRFNSNASEVSGTLIGLNDFNIQRGNDRQSWARLGFDLDHKFSNGVTMGGSTFVSTTGADPDVSGALTIKMPF